jgi:YVTN family beta-propeller protein
MRALSVLRILLTLGLAILVPPWHADASPEPQNYAVVAKIAVGSGPTGMAVNPTTNRIYVTNFISSDVSVIDGVSNTVVATVPVGPSPSSVGVNPVTNRIYVPDLDDRIRVIDGEANTVTDSIAGISADCYGVEVNSVTSRIYVSNFGAGRLLVIDGATDEALAIRGVGVPYGVAVNPTTNRIYVADATPGVGVSNVSVYDGDSDTFVAEIPTPEGAAPFGVAVNPVTNRIYATYMFGGTAWVIDGAANEIIATIDGLAPPYGTGGFHAAVNPETNRIYVASTALSVIDGASNAVVSVLPLAGYGAFGVAVNPTTNRIYVSLEDGVVVLDAAKLEEVHEEPIRDIGGSLPPTGSAPAQDGARTPLLLLISGTAALVLSTLFVSAALAKRER